MHAIILWIINAANSRECYSVVTVAQYRDSVVTVA
jgi:hypothetical protein